MNPYREPATRDEYPEELDLMPGKGRSAYLAETYNTWWLLHAPKAIYRDPVRGLVTA